MSFSVLCMVCMYATAQPAIIRQTSNERRWIYYSLCFVKPIIENAFEHANLCAIRSTNCLYNYRVVIDEFVVSRSHTDSNTACRYGTFITQLRKWTWCVAIDIILVSCVRHMISADCFFFKYLMRAITLLGQSENATICHAHTIYSLRSMIELAGR